MGKLSKLFEDVDKEVPFYKIDYGSMFYYQNYLFIKMLPHNMKVVSINPSEKQEIVNPNAFSLRNFEFTTIDKDAMVIYCGEETRNNLLTGWGYKDVKEYDY